MTLTLALLRQPAGGALAGAGPLTQRVTHGTFGIGRGPDNDWVLPDPERHLSKRHCQLSWQGEFWQVTDFSTNGTFLNGEPSPIGPGQVRDLRDGDRLRLGGYEMEVRIAEERPAVEAKPPLPAPSPFRLDDSLLIGLPPVEFHEPVQPDHRPAVEDAFIPPRPIALLGDDWDLDIPGVPPAEPAPQPAPKPSFAPEPMVTQPPQGSGQRDDLMAAFLRGAGVGDTSAGDPVAMMEGLGAAFRALVSGLRETMIARAAVKSEFRIEQTMIRARGNNPLKFAASDEDALASLLAGGKQSGMAPAAAIADALRDLRLHEIATMAAMQSAVHSLMREMAPAKLRDEGGGGALLPAQRKARAWDAYEALHGRITQALADDFDSVFGRAFARAYEQTVRDASRSEKTG
ncbi:MAG: type VI secretion system-associated FHA domain protein TagH [Proteobacteria bacterium]|nr:type VI secretion system-associated FHA domain protein TagH [Pseudomonadota bacterium]